VAAITVVSTMSSDPWGGSEELWAAAAGRLVGRGHEVRAVTKRWPKPSPRVAELQAAGVAFSYWRAPNRLARAILRVRSSQAVGRRLGDVAVFNQGGIYDFLGNAQLRAAVRRAQSAPIPYIAVVHSFAERPVPVQARARLRAYYEGAYAIVLPSPRLRQDLERRFSTSLPQARAILTPTHLLGHGVHAYPDGPTLRMACVGRLEVNQKGQDILLAALARTSWRARDWRLDFYGTGPDAAYLADLARFYELDQHVTFRGHTSDIAGVWRENQVLAMPSRIEARGIAITEAMACGRATIASAVGGIPDHVLDGRTGILAAATTTDAWHEALERLWSERSRLSAWGEEARRQVEGFFATDPIEELIALTLEAGAAATA
jgi:glycosyltransferase involved in cell wall biosynthesis